METPNAASEQPPFLVFAPDPTELIGEELCLHVSLKRVIDDCLGFLVTGSSGSGKSHAVRGLLEQTHGHVQQIIVDTEGEYVTLRERFDYLVAAKAGGDIPLAPATAAILCRRVMQLGVSVILDIYELTPRDRQDYVASFLSELIETPLEHRRPVFVAIPEVHLYAPQGANTPAKEAIRDLVARGRKRGIMPVFDTQSVAKTDKTALEAIRNKLVGYIELDVHLDRAAAELGLRGEDRETLRRLPRGTFYAQGPALSRTVTLVRTGPNLTHPPKMGAGVAARPALPTPAAIQEILSLFGDLPEQAAEEAKTIEEARDRISVLESKLALATAAIGASTESATAAAPPAPIRVEVEVPVLSSGQIDALGKASAMMLEGANALLAIGRDLQETGAQVGANLAKWAAVANVETFVSSPAPKAPTPQGIESQPSTAPEGKPKAGRPRSPGKTVESPSAPPESIPSDPEPSPEVAESRGEPPAPDVPAPVSAAQQKILDTIAEFVAIGIRRPAKDNVAVWSGASPTSGSYSGNLSRLRAGGLIEYFPGSTVGLTPAGESIARTMTYPKTRRDLVNAWKARLSTAQGTILDFLLAHRGKSFTRTEIARQVGASITSGSFSGNLSTLKDLGLIYYPSASAAAATDLLFPKGMPE